MRRILSVAFCFAISVSAWCQQQTSFQGLFTNEQFAVKSQINLYEADIPVPGMELDSCYGYLQGKLNGTWVIVQVKSLDEEGALVRAANDQGSDAQDVRITFGEDGSLLLRQVSGSCIKGVEGKKYVKLPKPFILQPLGR